MESDKIDRKELILDAAEILFSATGYDASSTRAIAAKAGVNIAMLNYYFGSKNGVYKAVLQRRLEVFEEPGMTTDDASSSWDQLYNYLDLHTECAFNELYFQRLVHRELSLQQRSDVSDYIIENLTRAANEIKNIISKGIENGSFRSSDIELTVASIFGTTYYLINSANLASKVLNKDLQNLQIIRDEIKPRVKKHLRELLSAHLKKHHAEN